MILSTFSTVTSSRTVDEIKSADYSIPFLLAVVLVAAVSFSPRIPLDLGLLGARRFDLRIEDLVLVAAVLSLVVSRSGLNRRIELPRSSRPLLVYLAAAAAATGIGIAAYDLSVFRGIFYFLKEIEYVLFALFVANVVRTRKQLYVLTMVFVGCALVNAGWAWVQILTDSTGPLFRTVRRGGYYGGPVASSGTKLIGEASRLSSGGYYVAPLSLCFGWFVAARESSRLRWGVIIAVLVVAIVASLSRASAISIAVAIIVVGLVADDIPTGVVVMIPTLGGIAGLGLSSVLGVARFGPAVLANGIMIRVQGWTSHIQDIDIGVIHGFGKGGLPLVTGNEEVHNQYLRLLVETGPVGLFAFIVFLALVAASGATLYYRSADPVVRAVGVAVLCATVSMALIALVQDALANVKLAESFWLLVGLFWAAVRIAR